MELASFWDVFSLLYYSSGDVPVCWSVLFEEGYRLLLISVETLLQPALVLELVSKFSSFGYNGVGNVTVKSTASSL